MQQEDEAACDHLKYRIMHAGRCRISEDRLTTLPYLVCVCVCVCVGVCKTKTDVCLFLCFSKQYTVVKKLNPGLALFYIVFEIVINTRV